MKPTIALVAALLLSAVSPAPAAELSGVARQIRHELVMLPYYGVFDDLTFKVVGDKVTLLGQVTRPTLKKAAERVVQRIESVQSVDNQIEVLPLSPNDDRIRLDAYRAIYYHPTFTRYALRSVPPIHIIVKNGDLRLVGAVATEADKTLAGIRANSLSGVFSVTNDLIVDGG